MMQKLDMSTWPRREHFRFFNRFEEPFFGLCTEVDCTRTAARAKADGDSFFLAYLHHSLTAANRTEPFRYRIQGDDVMVHDVVHASPTINRPDGTFGFAYMDYHEDFAVFAPAARKEIDRVRSEQTLIPATSGENVIHYTSLPWIRFTGFSNARAFSFRDSIPKIAFGKMTEDRGRQMLPVSIHVHHALMDGFHVAQFLELFQGLLNE
ncbi:MAG TPA: chloramphenicol acetyltransferase [Flavisolibacter sp.]